MTLISVIVPIYNAENTLSRTIESIIAQTLTDIEVILVDDGSSDKSSDIIADYCQKYSNIRSLFKENSGVADARNLAIANACSPLIAPIDADDIWHPRYLERMYEILSNAGPLTAFAYAGHRTIDMEDRVIRTSPIYDFSGRCYHRLLIRNCVGNGSSIVFRKEAAQRVGNYDRRLQHDYGAEGCEDWLLQSRLASLWNVACLPEYLVGYRWTPGAMSHNGLRLVRSRINALKLDSAEQNDRNPVLKYALADAHARHFIQSLLKGEVRESFRSLMFAYRMDYSIIIKVLMNRFMHKLSSWYQAALFRFDRRIIDQMRRFYDFQPKEDLKYSRTDFWAPYLERAASLDAQQPQPGSRDESTYSR